MYITLPVVFGVIITIILSMLKVEKANKEWDEKHNVEK